MLCDHYNDKYQKEDNFQEDSIKVAESRVEWPSDNKSYNLKNLENNQACCLCVGQLVEDRQCENHHKFFVK